MNLEEQLAVQIAGVRAELAALRAQIATEVVTRKVTVVDHEGRTRVDMTGHPYAGEIRVLALGDDGPAVLITAGEETIPPSAQLYLTGGDGAEEDDVGWKVSARAATE